MVGHFVASFDWFDNGHLLVALPVALNAIVSLSLRLKPLWIKNPSLECSVSAEWQKRANIRSIGPLALSFDILVNGSILWPISSVFL